MLKTITKTALTALLVASCFSVFSVHAAFNDVTLETTATIEVNGYELTISGSSAVVESLTVGAETLTVVLQNGSSITVASADRVDLAYDVAAQTTEQTCTESESTLTLAVASAGETTVVVTPSGTCTAEVEEEEEEETSSGGGGGTSFRRTSVSPDTPPTDTTYISILALLKELIQQFIDLGGTPSPEMLTLLGTPSADYSRDLELGMEGDDVRTLQTFLIQQNKGPQAQALANVGATGYFGPLTQAALAEYQAAVGITPAVGYFGPVTRAYIGGL